MSSDKYIQHVGFISAIDRGIAYVSLIQTSACASCAVKGVCDAASSESKQFEIPVKGDGWHVGEEVIVKINPMTGFLAVCLGYLLAFILVVSTLLIGLALGLSEARAGLAAILILVPYYATLALFKKRLQRKLHLKIMKR